MSTAVAKNLMAEMKLLGMLAAFDKVVADATRDQTSYSELLDALLQAEADYRHERKTGYRIKTAKFTLRLRLLEWAQGNPVPSDLCGYDDSLPPTWTLKVAGKAVRATPEKGYLAITREWRSGDTVELSLPMPVHAVHGNPHIAATRDRVAFERGPVVYCVEDLDRTTPRGSLTGPTNATVKAEPRPALLGGVTVLEIAGARLAAAPAGDSATNASSAAAPVVAAGSASKPVTLTAIPYYAWPPRGLAR